MGIVMAGFDVHRAQITFDALEVETGELVRGRIDATREAVAEWVGRFPGREVHVALEACTGWFFVSEALKGAGAVAHLAEPAETRARRGPKRRAKTDREDARWLRMLLHEGRLPGRVADRFDRRGERATPRHEPDGLGGTVRITTIIVGCVLVAMLAASPVSANDKPNANVYVDCAAGPGGDGTKRTPMSTITAALPIARDLAMNRDVTIAVTEGVCDHETFPIELNFPVSVKGSRAPAADDEGLPLDAQDHDTLVTWTPPSPVPPSVANLAFFRITGSDVRISKLSLDGKILPGTVTPAPPATAPIGVLAHKAHDYALDHLRIVRIGNAVRAQGASGHLRDTYAGQVGFGVVLSGGDPMEPPMVTISNNRVEDYWGGAFAVNGAGPVGQSIRAMVEGNAATTTYADTGPSNPFGVRIAPILSVPSLSGSIDATFLGNGFTGTPRYGIIVNGGQTVRHPDRRRYSGDVDATFANNRIDETAITRAVSLITFTNSRATELPCELDPANTKVQCPSLMGNPLQYWEYLEASAFDLHHRSELDDALIDHPDADPVDGRVLDNSLVINDAVVDHETFVAAP